MRGVGVVGVYWGEGRRGEGEEGWRVEDGVGIRFLHNCRVAASRLHA